MTAITFDTLAFAKQLKKSGVPEKQADVQTEIIAEIMNETVTHFATKHDLHTEIGKLRTELKKDITDLRIEVKQDISNLALKIGFMLVGNITVTVGLLTLVLKLASVI